MVNNWERFKHYVMSFSFSERRAKQLEQYRQMVAGLKQMQSDELDFEYITLKSEYEHKKNILTWLMMVIALAVSMNVWNNFLDFMKEVFQYAASMECNGVEIAKSVLLSL